MKQTGKKAGLLLLPIFIFLGMTNCSQFQSFSETDSARFLSANPIFENGVNQGQDPNDEVPGPIACVYGYRLNSAGTACEPITCPRGQTLNSAGTACEPITCPRGQTLNSAGTACEPITCPSGQTHNGNQCVPITCPSGQTLNSAGTACEPIICPSGQTLNSAGTACEPITCPSGQRPQGNQCVPIICSRGYRLNDAGTACVRIDCPSGYRLNDAGTACEPIPDETPEDPDDNDDNRGGSFGGGGGSGGGSGGGCPLMIDSQGVPYADINELRNSDDSYFKSGELSLTAPEDGVKFNLLGQQTATELDNGDFLHIKPQARNFKFQISWTQSDQSRYRWLTLPDSNGYVHGIDELFGDNTFGPDPGSPFAEDGFRALMKWDRGDATESTQNFSDGYIDSKDAVFSRLRLWHDLNGDGNCDTDSEVASELVSLSEVGITYIHLMFNENFRETDIYGNDIAYKSLVGFKTSGEETRLGTAFDIWFRYNAHEVLETGHAEIKPNF